MKKFLYAFILVQAFSLANIYAQYEEEVSSYDVADDDSSESIIRAKEDSLYNAPGRIEPWNRVNLLIDPARGTIDQMYEAIRYCLVYNNHLKLNNDQYEFDISRQDFVNLDFSEVLYDQILQDINDYNFLNKLERKPSLEITRDYYTMIWFLKHTYTNHYKIEINKILLEQNSSRVNYDVDDMTDFENIAEKDSVDLFSLPTKICQVRLDYTKLKDGKYIFDYSRQNYEHDSFLSMVYNSFIQELDDLNNYDTKNNRSDQFKELQLREYKLLYKNQLDYTNRSIALLKFMSSPDRISEPSEFKYLTERSEIENLTSDQRVMLKKYLEIEQNHFKKVGEMYVFDISRSDFIDKGFTSELYDFKQQDITEINLKRQLTDLIGLEMDFDIEQQKERDSKLLDQLNESI